MDTPYIVWFDIDNTLYSAQTGIANQMGRRIQDYFKHTFPGDPKGAEALHLEYYTKHGLALRGLMMHNGVDPVKFDEECDQKLSLDSIVPSASLKRLLSDINRTKAHVWALTNAYKVHASRVLKRLEIDDQFDGVVYCRYDEPPFVCKPDDEYYTQALAQAKVRDPSHCYFVDDNRKNVDAAHRLGWRHCVHFCERGLESMEGGRLVVLGNEQGPGQSTHIPEISDLEELRSLWPEIFKS